MYGTWHVPTTLTFVGCVKTNAIRCACPLLPISGETDEIGYRAAVDPVTVHDLHATMLHLLGLDHKRLTYLHNGRLYRLTDVAGNVLSKILA